ncbi:MAG: GGDEF domain-containing protein [Planctomycetota bacterium]|jgi:diguanylate cyclase (GGDEF)-like protein
MSIFNSDKPKILVIGDISKGFVAAEALGRLPCEVHRNMLDAIDTAARDNFAAIAVVMSGVSPRLVSALEALRKAGSDAKIILLAQMYEEPLAMKLVGTGLNGSRAADGYLICPIHYSQLYEYIMPPSGLQAGESGAGAPVDYATEQRIRQLEEMAITDELTGLKNRRYIWEFARQIIEHAKQTNGRVTLLVFDIDNFKHYNDVYSHSAGDEILKQAAVLMQRSCRGHDVVGRIGGDEFAVIFWDDPKRKTGPSEDERRSAQADHPKEAIFIAKRFRRELNKAELPLLGEEGKGVLAISGGLASFPRDGLTIQQLFGQADKALLDAKRSGKNRIYLVGKSQSSDISDIE